MNSDNIMIYGQNFLQHPVKDNARTYESIRKIATCLGDGNTIGYLLDYSYFKENCKLIFYRSKQITSTQF